MVVESGDFSGPVVISSGGRRRLDSPGDPEISDIPPDFGLLKTVTSGGRQGPRGLIFQGPQGPMSPC